MGVGWYTLISSKKDCDNAPSTASNENIIHIIWCMGSDSMFIVCCVQSCCYIIIYTYIYTHLFWLCQINYCLSGTILLCQWIVYKNHGWIMDAQCIYLMNQCSFFQICGGWCLVGVGCGPFKMYHPKSVSTGRFEGYASHISDTFQYEGYNYVARITTYLNRRAGKYRRRIELTI